MSRILIVDDEANMRRILAGMLRDDGHEVTESHGIGDATFALRSNIFDLVITDQRMPDGDGIGLVAACRETDPALPVVVLTAFATVELAVEAMRSGAFDFLTKPFSPEQVRSVVRRATERAELVRDNERLRRQIGRIDTETEILGDSASIRRLIALVQRVGPTGATVLVAGETGTGKELVARMIHATSPRHDRPFLAVNCAAFTETLLDAELFGHERGAFTGADRTRQGVFETAHRGTLFLDEAAEMSLGLQAKLLRVLTDGEVTRVGSATPRHVDVRLVVATNRDLRARVGDGSFREDLYYRLAVVEIDVPPLRERLDDLPTLTEHFLDRAAIDLAAPRRRLSSEALDKLRGYAFPGNVRELRNLIERASILSAGDTIEPADLLLPGNERDAADPVARFIQSLPDSLDLRGVLAEVEKAILERAMKLSQGVQAEAARRTGISRSDIHYKLRRREID